MNIAICDDVKKEAELLETLCHELNYLHTTLFLSGEEFLSSPSLHDFNILFLDIEMPGISGLELMKQLSFSHPSLLVIFSILVFPLFYFLYIFMYVFLLDEMNYLCYLNLF